MYPKVLNEPLTQTVIDQMWIYYRFNDYPYDSISSNDTLLNYLQDRFLYPDQLNISDIDNLHPDLNRYFGTYNSEWKNIFTDFVLSGAKELRCVVSSFGDNVYIIEKVQPNKYKCKWGSVDRNDIESLGDCIRKANIFGNWCIVNITQ